MEFLGWDLTRETSPIEGDPKRRRVDGEEANKPKQILPSPACVKQTIASDLYVAYTDRKKAS